MSMLLFFCIIGMTMQPLSSRFATALLLALLAGAAAPVFV